VLLGLNTSLSGVPYWGTDIGGFFPTGLTAESSSLDGSAPPPASAPSGTPAGAALSLGAELYTRWFQFGALCPLFRSHGWVWRQHVPWAHGPEVEAICRRYAELRMQLLPYLYTLAWLAHTRGEPLMRPLVYSYPADPNVWELGSQYLLGPDLLVAPVTRPGSTHWPVYLPAGEWYDFWTHERLAGGRGVTAAAPLATVPVFVRGGAIITTAPAAQRSAEQARDDLTLLVYPPAPGGSSEALLYEDDGETQAYRRGEHALTTLRCRADAHTLRVEVDAAVGRYAGQPPKRDLTIRLRVPHVPTDVAATLDGGEASTVSRREGADTAGTCWWDEAPSLVWVRLPAVPLDQTVAVALSSS
jgi:alpha-glucosidase (family GH31 glycosyl hydrolase)